MTKPEDRTTSLNHILLEQPEELREVLRAVMEEVLEAEMDDALQAARASGRRPVLAIAAAITAGPWSRVWASWSFGFRRIGQAIFD